jgi:cytochrome c biogenesis protein CcdA
MQEWINSVLSSDHAGITVLVAVFFLGIVSVFSCGCNFAVIGTLAAYTGAIGATKKTKTVIVSSLFFLLGIVVTMSVIGFVIGFTSEFISTSLGSYWKIGAGIISIFFGLYIIDLLPFKIPGISMSYKNKNNGIIGAILFGLMIGGLSSLCGLCCSPIFPVIMAASFVKGSMVWGILMLFAYSLGYGFTLTASMLGLGLGVGKISNSLSRVAIVLKYVGGITLICLGFYYLFTF